MPLKDDLLIAVAAMSDDERRRFREGVDPDAKSDRLAKERAARRSEIVSIYNRAIGKIDALGPDDALPEIKELLAD